MLAVAGLERSWLDTTKGVYKHAEMIAFLDASPALKLAATAAASNSSLDNIASSLASASIS